jgi:hypothetical protein
MANTAAIRKQIHPYIREFLQNRFGQKFTPQQLELINVQADPRTYLFDVSEDGTIACAFKSTSWATPTSPKGSGKVESLWKEIYFLSLCPAKRKLLVLTNGQTYEKFSEESSGKLVRGIELLYCQLPPELHQLLEKTKEEASKELTR